MTNMRGFPQKSIYFNMKKNKRDGFKWTVFTEQREM